MSYLHQLNKIVIKKLNDDIKDERIRHAAWNYNYTKHQDHHVIIIRILNVLVGFNEFDKTGNRARNNRHNERYQNDNRY